MSELVILIAAAVCAVAWYAVLVARQQAHDARRLVDELTVEVSRLYREKEQIMRRDVAWYDALSRMRGES